MLTADLVRARQKGKELHVSPLLGKTRERALALAETYLGLARAGVGDCYEELKEAWNAVELDPKDRKLGLGLQKLIEDDCEIGVQSPFDPRELRSRVFLEAAAARRETPRDFNREAVLKRALQALRESTVQPALSEKLGEGSLDTGLGLNDAPEAIEVALYSDLRSQHRVFRVPEYSGATLVERYDVGQYQAVLLRATKVTARIQCRSTAVYRDVFRALKFRRLLYTIAKQHDGYHLEIDGPMSLFDSVTKYGLQLALVFPTLCACDELKLEAEVAWGKSRRRMIFRYESTGAAQLTSSVLPDEITDLMDRFQALGSSWSVKPSTEVLDLPGVGVIVPDSVFSQGEQSVYFELLGFWSRDAVWKRVELVRRGFSHPMLFAVSTRLRVSEAALDDDAPSALYVFKGVMNPRQVLAKLEQLARAKPQSATKQGTLW